MKPSFVPSSQVLSCTEGYLLQKQKQCTSEERNRGDRWIGLSFAGSRGLILAACVGKYTNAFIEKLVINTGGKTDCKQLNMDDWGGDERRLPLGIDITLVKIKHSDWSGRLHDSCNRSTIRLSDMLLTALAPIAWGTTYVVATKLLPPNYSLLLATLRSQAGELAIEVVLTHLSPKGVRLS